MLLLSTVETIVIITWEEPEPLYLLIAITLCSGIKNFFCLRGKEKPSPTDDATRRDMVRSSWRWEYQFSSPHVDFQTGCKRRRRKGSIGVAVHLSLCDDKIVIFHKETFIRQSSPQPVLVTIIFLSILWTVAKSGDKLNSSFISGSTSLCPQHTDATYSWPAASSAEGHPKNKSSLWCVCGELRNEWSNGQIFCGPLPSTVFWSKVSLTNAATAPWLCNFTLLPLAVVARQ